MPFASHHVMIGSRQNPPSPRITILTWGQAWRICATIR